MPLQASPFTPLPSFISQPAQSMQGSMTPPGMPQMGPPGAQVPPPPGGPGGGLPSSNPLENMAASGMGGAAEEPDLFQRVASLMTQNPMWVLLFAGMGMREALEKTGKYKSNPHRSNQENQAAGYDVGTPGQTGMPNEDQLAKQAMPPGMPQMGQQVGFPG